MFIGEHLLTYAGTPLDAPQIKLSTSQRADLKSSFLQLSPCVIFSIFYPKMTARTVAIHHLKSEHGKNQTILKKESIRGPLLFMIFRTDA